MANKWVYTFKEGNMTMRNLLGGKGANLAEMTEIGLPVPQGFTISTEACTQYYEDGRKINDEIMAQTMEGVKWMEEVNGKKFGDLKNPLLVSVRSGARASMPGMMDTILNLGLNDEVVAAMIEGNPDPKFERFVYDSYRRFIQMFSDVVMEVGKKYFEQLIDKMKAEKGVEYDVDLTAADLKTLAEQFKAEYKKQLGEDFPSDPVEQLKLAIEAVFRSWDNPRANVYRRDNDIPYSWGTAVNVMPMVFGNLNDESGTGVAFTRDPATGENKLMGEFLKNAQGEDVVAGVRTPMPIAQMEQEFPEAYAEFIQVCETLENHYHDMQDMEFTVENKKLYICLLYTSDAGIGSEITGGYDSGTLQPTFSVIAKNTNPQEKEHFLAVIRETLEGLVKNGLNKKSLLAGINSSEFRYREADFGHFPKGLLYGIQCLDSWLYDDMRPFLHLEALDTYRFLKEQVETDYFEQLIQKYLLNNKHASVVIIEPEKGLNAKNEAALEKKLAEYKAGLSEDEIRKLIADTKHLKEYQETPSPKEDLEKIPMLARSDMKKEAAPFYNTELSVKGIPVVHHDIYSNGIIYLTMLFDIAHIPAEDIPYLGVLKAVLGYVDTKNYSYADFANEVNIHTGGISSTIGVYPSVKDKDDYQVKFEVRTKALYDKLPEAATLMKEMLFTSNIDDEKRLYEIIAELKSRLQVSISSAGHSVASTRAMTYFSKAAAYKDTITFYETLCDLEAHFDERKEALTAKLKEMVSSIFTKEHLLVSVTCEKDGLSIVETELEKFIPMLYETSGEEKQAEIVPVRKNEGFMDASQVLYVARAGNFRAHGFDYHGALRILKVIMEYDYLWINIRVKGGAYGCMNGYMKNGDTYFVSYRDPNLEKTNEIYDGIPAYIEQFTADERDMTKYIIGTISDMDVPMNPSTKGDRSMAAYLQNISYEEIQKERDQVIGATQEDIRGLRDMIASVLAENNLCVVGNEETLQASEGMFGEVKHLNESER